MTPRDLADLDALIKEGTFKQAAHRRGVSQATFEHRIRRLRNRTGMTTIQLVAWRGKRQAA